MHSAGHYLQLTMYVWTVYKPAAVRTYLKPTDSGPISAPRAAAVRLVPLFYHAMRSNSPFYSKPQLEIQYKNSKSEVPWKNIVT